MLRILLVDDDEDDYIITADLLSEIEGQLFHLDWETDYQIALKSITANEYNVYLVDYRLGMHNGLDLIRQATQQGCTAPVILLTGQGDRRVDLEAMQAGASDYLVKGQLDAYTLERSIRYATERKRSEEALKQSMQKIEQAKLEWEATADSMPHLVCLLDTEQRIIRANRQVEAWNLEKVTNVYQKHIHHLFHPNCPNPNCYFINLLAAACDKLSQGQTVETEVEDPILNRALYLQISPMAIAPFEKRSRQNKSSSFAVLTVEDITERKLLEKQLRQSQKMEAVGQLAGGVAHDFNNLLTAILGYSQFLLRTIKEDDPLHRDILEIQKAGKRAASLTRQLLAFSRKQILQPKILNLNLVVSDMEKLLRRLIGEDITLITFLDQQLGLVKADPGQMEQVIINLAVNARDAMPNGGKLIIETSNTTLDQTYTRQHINVKPGPYVMVAITDTGHGMDIETRTHIFEPFFSTKTQNKGTGLGLATVHGIVKQSGGHIWVYSEEGTGSTFKVYLPQIPDAQPAHIPEHLSTETHPGTETILLVEDEAMVRELTCNILRQDGYQVIEANHGTEALKLSQNYTANIDLLLTDVVMPGGLNGPQLQKEIMTQRPDIKVLFMSGYTDNSVIQYGILKQNRAFLQKPFTPATLSKKVRQILDSNK